MVEQIKQDHKITFELTAREFIGYFGCYRRTSGNCLYIDSYLENNGLVNNWSRKKKEFLKFCDGYRPDSLAEQAHSSALEGEVHPQENQ